MGKIVVVKTTGEEITLPADDKLDIRLMYLAIGCNVVERIKVRYEGKVRDAYLDEEGLLRPVVRMNPKIKEYAEAYYGRPCQDFAGNAAIWIPTPRKPKGEISDPAVCRQCGYRAEECKCHAVS
jgi:hypothetical protein